MAIVDIQFNCGCGTKVKTVEEAIIHADNHMHTLTVQGTVRSTERKIKATPTNSTDSRPRRKPAAVPVYVEEIGLDDSNFSDLRSRLQRK